MACFNCIRLSNNDEMGLIGGLAPSRYTAVFVYKKMEKIMTISVTIGNKEVKIRIGRVLNTFLAL